MVGGDSSGGFGYLPCAAPVEFSFTRLPQPFGVDLGDAPRRFFELVDGGAGDEPATPHGEDGEDDEADERGAGGDAERYGGELIHRVRREAAAG